MSTSARECARELAPQITEPPLDWSNRLDFEFLNFTIHIQRDNCTSCGATFSWGQVYRAFIRRVGFNPDTQRRLTPATQVPSGFPVVTVHLPPREVPICPQCVSGDRPSTVVLLLSSEAEWNEARKRDREAREASKGGGGAKVIVAPLSLGDIPG